MRALAPRATVKKHVNVLQHIMGFFKKQLSPAEKRELAGVIGDYAVEYLYGDREAAFALLEPFDDEPAAVAAAGDTDEANA